MINLPALAVVAVALCSGFLVGVFYHTSTPTVLSSAVHKPVVPPAATKANETIKGSMKTEKVQKALLRAMKSLAVAHRYSRSGRTMTEISGAFQGLYSLYATITNDLADGVEPLNPTDNVFISRSTAELERTGFVPDVCPEVWFGMKHGYPYYETGFEMLANCTIGKKVAELVTIIAYFTQGFSSVDLILSSIWVTYPETQIVLVSPDNLKTGFKNITRVNSSNVSPGVALNSAVSKVKTRYALIAKDLVLFSNESRLERLIRMVNVAGVDIAAGSQRNVTGHWERGCFQMKMAKYAFKLVEGYDLSYNSCIYCDYSSGPFLAKTKFLKKHPFEVEVLSGEPVFVDFFLRIQRRSLIAMTCPDAMFYVQEKSKISYMSKADWQPFATHHVLNSIHAPSITQADYTITTVKHSFSCADIKHTCLTYHGKGTANLPCCNQILADMLKYLFKMGPEHDIELEIEAGTNVGAVKQSSILLWELDADVDYPAKGSGQSKLRSLIPQFKKDGFGLSESTKCTPPYKTEVVNCGYFAYRKSPFRIEMWGTLWMASDALKKKNISTTKAEIDGSWYPTYPNPAKAARNEYGDDIYQHVEHWINLGWKSGWIPYKTGAWLPCKKPGHHSCLDQYLPFGTLQFLEPWL